ncbi:hypothetical protein [Planococcus salinus]|nr:hypothetical protein [Planococcus salinus]
MNLCKVLPYKGKVPVFDPVKLGIENADFWDVEYEDRELIEPDKDKNGSS